MKEARNGHCGSCYQRGLSAPGKKCRAALFGKQKLSCSCRQHEQSAKKIKARSATAFGHGESEASKISFGLSVRSLGSCSRRRARHEQSTSTPFALKCDSRQGAKAAPVADLSSQSVLELFHCGSLEISTAAARASAIASAFDLASRLPASLRVTWVCDATVRVGGPMLLSSLRHWLWTL
jgi:hypothetical protein